MIGIIGGSGLYEVAGVVIKEIKSVVTPFGTPSDFYRIGDISGKEVSTHIVREMNSALRSCISRALRFGGKAA